MEHSICNELFEMLSNGKYKYIVEYVKSDDTLNLRFKGNSVEIYYRGLNIAYITKNKVKPNNTFKKGRSWKAPAEICEETFEETIPRLKQNIDRSFVRKGTYENEFSQLIDRENNSKKLGNVTDYFILEDEYKVDFYDGKKEARPDLIGVHISRTQRRKLENSTHKLAWIEVKYQDSAYGDSDSSDENQAGIKTHISDYARLYADINKKVLNDMAKDVCKIFKQKKKLELLPGVKGAAENINISPNPEDVEFILLLIGHNTRSGINKGEDKKDLITILSEAVDENKKEVIDNVYIAKTCEIGFALYEDRMVNIRDYIAQNE